MPCLVRPGEYTPRSSLPSFIRRTLIDLQPHVAFLQVGPKAVFCWGNHYIQRHPLEHSLSRSQRHTVQGKGFDAPLFRRDEAITVFLFKKYDNKNKFLVEVRVKIPCRQKVF